MGSRIADLVLLYYHPASTKEETKHADFDHEDGPDRSHEKNAILDGDIEVQVGKE